MKRSIALSGVVLLAISTVLQATSGPTRVEPRRTALAITPARFSTGQGFSLLIAASDRTEGDAVPLYQQAVQNLPTNINSAQLTEWTRQPLDELPLGEVEAFLGRAKPALKSIDKAVRCQECNWPPFVANQMPENLSEYRTMTFILHVKARLEIARGQYDEAVRTLQTGLTMAQQIGESPVLTQVLVGQAMASMMLRGLDDLAQAPSSPNLYTAIASLPCPLIDIEKVIAAELQAYDTNTRYPRVTLNAMRQQAEPAYERIRQIARRYDSEQNARQCIQAIRDYVATHDGNLPAQLSDVEAVELPEDPVMDMPFKYNVTGGQAVLETGLPEGGSAREAMRFEITVAR